MTTTITMNLKSQSRKYNVTINNPIKYGFNDEEIKLTLNSLLSVDYYCFAHEKGSTEHVHIFMFSKSPIRFGTVQRKFPIAHIEKANGTAKENRDYIKKEGKWADTDKAHTVIKGSFYEFGVIPSEGREKAPRQFELLELIRNGTSTMDIIREHPQYSFKGKDIDILRDIYLTDKYSKMNRNVKVTYIWGKTAVGKTKFIYDNFNAIDVCRITNYRNDKVNFDAYHSQKILVFDEFRSQIPISEMLSYLDNYPLRLPARYSDRTACFTEVYILSNISLQDQYPHVQVTEKETWSAFLRRFDSIIEMQKGGKQIQHNKEEFIL